MRKFLKIALTTVLCCLTFATITTLSACKCNHEYENGKCVKCGAWVITEGVEYALTEDGDSYGVVGFSSKAAAEVYILPEYNGKPVTTVFREAFANSNIVSVNIPDSVTTIKGGAFAGCGRLVKVNISDSVTSIGDSAFGSCRMLTSITIPDSITSIGKYAFNGCSGLTGITIPNSVTSIGSGAFEDCEKLTERSKTAKNLQKFI